VEAIDERQTKYTLLLNPVQKELPGIGGEGPLQVIRDLPNQK
jgi:hypothetical protein